MDASAEPVCVDLGASKSAAAIAAAGLVRASHEPVYSSDRDPAAAGLALRWAIEALGAHAAAARLAIGGPGLRLHVVSARARVARVVDAAAARKALLAAAAEAAALGDVLHLFVDGYAVDEGPVVADPRGRAGRIVAAHATALVAPPQARQSGAEALRAAGLALEAPVAAPYAMGLAALTAQEQTDGAIALDLGAETTTIAAFRHGRPVHIDALTVGQSRLTAALAHALGASCAAAETIKRREGGLVGARGGAGLALAARFGADGRLEPAEVSRDSLAAALSRPADDLLFGIADALAKAPLPDGAERWPVVLVGGGARLAGLAELAAAALARPVRIATTLRGAMGAGPEDAVAVGAVLWRGRGPAEAKLPGPHAGAARGRHGRLRQAFGWLRENL